MVFISIILIQSCTEDNINDLFRDCVCERTITENGVTAKGLPKITPILKDEDCVTPATIVDSTAGSVVITSFDCHIEN